MRLPRFGRDEPSSLPVDEPDLMLTFHDVRSDDGTHLRAWTNDPEGRPDRPTVVLCNGLGTNPLMWPGLLSPDCPVRVVSWYHRGVGGSERPTDPHHVEIEHFVEDGLSVLDHFGVERAVHLGWSMGVNTMFEMAARHPERVSGLFAVCGVPGDTFATMLGPFHLPHPVARVLMVNLARAARLNGWAITQLLQRVDVGPRLVHLLSHSGFMFPVADPELSQHAVAEFIDVDAGWYAHLALSTSKHARVSLSAIRVPALFVGASHDLLAGSRDMASAAAAMGGPGRYVELRGSHFLPLERPDELNALLAELMADVDEAEHARGAGDRETDDGEVW